MVVLLALQWADCWALNMVVQRAQKKAVYLVYTSVEMKVWMWVDLLAMNSVEHLVCLKVDYLVADWES